MIGQANPDDLIFLDESGIDTRLTRSHARAPGGERAIGHVPGGQWKRLTVLGAIARDGFVAVMTATVATSTAVFLTFIEQMLLPALEARPNAIVLMDNLAAHKAAAVRAALERAGRRYRYLPPYSPDFNPIEPGWGKLKDVLRSVGPRTIEALQAALPDALDAITPANATASFDHQGYRSK